MCVGGRGGGEGREEKREREVVGRGQEGDIVKRIRAEKLAHISYPQQHLVHAV